MARSPILCPWAWRQALERRAPIDWSISCFSPGVNAPRVEVASPVANAALLAAGKTSGTLALPSRSLVGFLSVFNGILDLAELAGSPVPAQGLAMPRGASVLPNTVSDCQKRVAGLVQTSRKSTSNLQTLHSQRETLLNIVAGTLSSSPLQEVSTPRWTSPTGSGGADSKEARPSLGNPSPISLGGPAKAFAPDVAFELRLTPQEVAANDSTSQVQVSGLGLANISPVDPKSGVPVSLPIKEDTRTESEMAINSSARQANSHSLPEFGFGQPIHETSQSESSSGRSIDPGHANDAPNFIQRTARAQENVTTATRPESTLTLAEEPSQISSGLGSFFGSAATNPADSPILRGREAASWDGEPEKTRTLPTLPRKDADQRATHCDLAAAQRNISGQPVAAPPKDGGKQEHEDKSDSGTSFKATSKPDGGQKTVTNPRDGRSLDGTGVFTFVPSRLIGQSRTAAKSESPPLADAESGQASPSTTTTLSDRPQPMREISLKVHDNVNRVDIQVVERAGNLRVAVRTADQDLNKSLQTNLGELVGRFEAKGYKTETWIPAAGSPHSSAPMMETANNPQQQSQDQSDPTGSWSGQQQQQGHRESDQRQQARWMTQFDDVLDEEDESTKHI